MSRDGHWVIQVAGYGHVFFEGTEKAAEEMRAHKANWEQGVGWKRRADPGEIEAGKALRSVEHRETVWAPREGGK